MVLLERDCPLEQEFGVTRTQKLSEMCENAVLQHDLGHLGVVKNVVHIMKQILRIDTRLCQNPEKKIILQKIIFLQRFAH